MYSIQISDGAQFPARAGESLLDAAGRARIRIPYSCKTGRCSSCRVKVLEGGSNALSAETGLSEIEKNEGWVLSCVRSAASDMLLEIENLVDIELPSVKTIPARVNTLERLAPDVIRVVLRIPPGSNFSFVPGQYIDVIGDGGIRRSYSLAKATAEEHLLELHIRAVAHGAMSDYWFNRAQVNDLLRFNGPLGTFYLRESAGKDLIFLATGTGIAPVKALLEQVSKLTTDKAPNTVSIFWGGRTESDLYLDLNAVPGEFQYVPVLSRSDTSWRGGKGYVQQVCLDRCPNLTNASVYACGSDAMIHSARDAFVNEGLSERYFYSDAFVCSGTSAVN